MIRWVAYAAVLLVLLAAGAWVFVYEGAYDVGADQPHWRLTARVLGVIRDRSIAVRASGLAVPDLADPDLIALGAEHYAEMCTGCHLTPGAPDTELRRGLNPQPPRLALPGTRTPAEAFWIIKHGIRMTGMPAWGATHDDRAIWGLVAFTRKLPTLDAAAYSKLTGAAEHESHDHDQADGGDHEH
jgi:mono/diheme cytochrome c family protein